MGTCGGAEDTGYDWQDVDENSLRAKFEAAGQGHVFNAFDELDEESKEAFLQQCASFDVNHINTLYQDLIAAPGAA